jgi:hypothetical protein
VLTCEELEYNLLFRWFLDMDLIEPSFDPTVFTKKGLLVRTHKQLGSAEYPNIVEEYEVDTGLLKELREHEKQAAQELGQWSEKSNVEQGPIEVQVVWSDQDAHP